MYELGAAVVGTGFIGAVHVEALRRIGNSVSVNRDPKISFVAVE